MGIVFGITGAKEPSFIVYNLPNLVKVTNSYQIRGYEPYLIAEVLTNHSDNSFNILAKYIGVIGKPANEQSKLIAMTSPVLTESIGKKLEMTSPVTETNEAMQFILPFEYKELSQLPIPTDKRVSLRQIPSKLVAVKAFSGCYSKSEGKKQYKALLSDLRIDKLVSETEDPEWVVAQYHPPFTLPFFRRNEIWIELDKHKSEVKQLKEVVKVSVEVIK
mmetsp:Transcript_8934/g.7976  ORF Transcript_8934/g.7976 Transcript_8934/m.7976 type:complete len:218 (+) Transcript_8934:65-718(+)